MVIDVESSKDQEPLAQELQDNGAAIRKLKELLYWWRVIREMYKMKEDSCYNPDDPFPSPTASIYIAIEAVGIFLTN